MKSGRVKSAWATIPPCVEEREERRGKRREGRGGEGRGGKGRKGRGGGVREEERVPGTSYLPWSVQ